jgi:hypothetical protein
VTGDYDDRELWALPVVHQAWEASHRVLARGISHAVRQRAPILFVHLRWLSNRLTAQRAIAALAGDPEIQ